MSEEPRQFFSRRLQKHIEEAQKREADKAARKAARVLKAQAKLDAPPSLPPVAAQEESTTVAPLSVDATQNPEVVRAVTQKSELEQIRQYDRLPESRYRKYPANSSIRAKAIKIVAMRTAGLEDAEIAQIMKVTKQTIRNYVYIAARHEWLNLADPKQQLEYQVMHKVVRNLDDALDDEERNRNTGVKVKTEVAMRVAEGTIFKQFEQQLAPQQAQSVVAIQIVMPPGAKQEIREDTVQGVAAYVEGETVD